MIEHFFLFFFLAFISEIIGTIGGFGSSVFFVPIASYFFDFQNALGLTALFHLSSNLSKIALFRKGLNKKLLFNLGIPAVIFVIIGGLLTSYFDSKILEFSLSIFLIILSLLFLIFKNIEIKPEFKQSVIGGSLSGFFAGFLGTGGAIRGLTMAAFNLPKSIFVATSAAIDFAVDLSRTIVYFSNGYIHKGLIIYLPILFAIGLIGSYLGKKILDFIPQEKFRLISLVMILIIGFISLGTLIFK